MFTYCTQILHLAEHAAYNRIEAARAVRRFPIIGELLTEGRIHLSALRLLSPHLTDANHVDVLRQASHKSKREIEEIVARLQPRPDVAPSVRKLPSVSAPRTAQAAPGHPSPLKPRPLRRSTPRQPAQKLNHSPRGDTKSSSPSRRTRMKSCVVFKTCYGTVCPPEIRQRSLIGQSVSYSRRSRNRSWARRIVRAWRRRRNVTSVTCRQPFDEKSGPETMGNARSKAQRADVKRLAFSNSITWCRTRLVAQLQSTTWSFAAPRTTGTRPNDISGCSFVRFSLRGTPFRHERKTS